MRIKEENLPPLIREEFEDMWGFDGCECQSIDWGYNPQNGNWYSRRFGCGTGTQWIDRILYPDGKIEEVVVKDYPQKIDWDIEIEWKKVQCPKCGKEESRNIISMHRKCGNCFAVETITCLVCGRQVDSFGTCWSSQIENKGRICQPCAQKIGGRTGIDLLNLLREISPFEWEFSGSGWNLRRK